MSVVCPVPVCPANVHISGRMRKHLMYRNFRSKIAVLQEGRDAAMKQFV